MTNYKVAPFYQTTFAQPSGATIWNFLNAERTIGKMVAASFYNRPAVEPLALDLIALFPVESRDAVLDETCKRMIGHMARQVMEAQGLQLVIEDAPISDNALFKTGATYKDRADLATGV
jgi:hypothetical protein